MVVAAGVVEEAEGVAAEGAAGGRERTLVGSEAREEKMTKASPLPWSDGRLV